MIPPSRLAIQHEISTIKQINEWHEQVKDRADKLSYTVTNYVKKTLDSADIRFSNILVYNIMGGCFTSTWNPEVTLDHNDVAYVGDGKFVLTNSPSLIIFPTDIIDGELPFDGKKLLNLCEKLTRQLGIPVNFRKKELFK